MRPLRHAESSQPRPISAHKQPATARGPTHPLVGASLRKEAMLSGVLVQLLVAHQGAGAGGFTIEGDVPVLVGSSTPRGSRATVPSNSSSGLLYFPMLSHRFVEAGGASEAILLRAQTSPDLDLPCSDATFVSYDNGSSWAPTGRRNCAQGSCVAVQKRVCYPYPPGAADRALCLPYARDVGAPPGPHPYVWPASPPPSAACQRRLDAYCLSDATCMAATKKFKWNASLVARYDTGCGQPHCSPLPTAKAWRCYSPDALDAAERHWSNTAKHPDAYCTQDAALRAVLDADPACKSHAPGTANRTHWVNYLGTVWQLKGGVLAADPALSDSVPVRFSDPFMRPGSRRFTDGNAIPTTDGKMLLCMYAMDGEVHAGASGFCESRSAPASRPPRLSRCVCVDSDSLLRV